MGFNPELPSERATDLVRGSRRVAYGHPAPIAITASELWSTWLRCKVTPLDVQMCMALHKMARERHRAQEDNLTDICGYVNIYELTQDYLNQGEEIDGS